MRKTALCALLLCCVFGGARAAAPEAEALLQTVPETAQYWDVLPALLKDPGFVYEHAVGGAPTTIASAEDYLSVTGPCHLELESNLAACDGQPEDWRGNQGILVKFRINGDSGPKFEFYAIGCGAVVLDLTAPDFPAVGATTQPQKYLQIGRGYSFVRGEWFYALFASDENARLRLALWQDGAPHNMAYYKTDLAEDGWYEAGEGFANRKWSLYAVAAEEIEAAFDVAGYAAIGFAGFWD